MRGTKVTARVEREGSRWYAVICSARTGRALRVRTMGATHAVETHRTPDASMLPGMIARLCESYGYAVPA